MPAFLVLSALIPFLRLLTASDGPAGAAMAPTLNAKAASPQSGSSPSATSSSSITVEKLLMRCIPRPSLRAVFTGDVVAFNSPLAGPGAEHLMVRRVAAIEGEELITDDPAEEAYTIPEGML